MYGLRSMDGMSDEALPVVAVVRDLMFVSKITGAATAQGSTVKIIRDPAKLAGESGRLLIVDLNLPGAIEAAAAWLPNFKVSSIGFVSHVDADSARRAREAGIEQVMARSRFVEVLEELFAKH
jgi:glutamyl-tRNA reductase